MFPSTLLSTYTCTEIFIYLSVDLFQTEMTEADGMLLSFVDAGPDSE